MKSLLLSLGLAACSMSTHAVGSLADVKILDRDSGQTLPVYRRNGEYWVAGRPGARYAVMIHNLRGQRVLAVTSVDGVNVISGETAAFNQTGYVFSGGEQYAINGWRKSDQEVAEFNFTSLANSYAARTGRGTNVGVIGVALFLEREPVPQVAPPYANRSDLPEPPAPAPEASLRERDAATVDRLAGVGSSESYARKAAPRAEQLGTGHGAREYSYVTNTNFERLSNSPNEIIRIRYDSYENLVAMGIVRPRPLPSEPDAFPDSAVSRYVPDPPGA
jgi:hypothetical protein